MLISFASNDEETWKGYLYVILLVGINVIKTLLTSQYFYKLQNISLRIRTVLASAIYNKSLLLSAASRKERTGTEIKNLGSHATSLTSALCIPVGETVNLMSIDTQRFMDVIWSLNTVWSAPTIIGLSLFFLWGYLGPSSLAGLAIMVLLMPINAVISTRMRKLQFANMRNKDQRIKVMNEILDGVKVIKLYAWEPSFGDKVKKIREEEVDNLKKVSYLSAIQTFLFVSAPFMVAVASFATFVLSDKNNVLDAEKAFVSISYFNLMRMPLNQLPNLIVQLIQVSVSLKRVNNFMNAKEIDRDAISRDNNGPNAVEMSKATFTWDPESKPAVKDFDLTVKKGSFVAVVGQVGAGKSSLLAALTSDMDKIEGKVNVAGSVAFVPQQPWIQNSTLKYNITFGKEHNDRTYEKVIDACSMRPDLEILDKGDMTEIGEKGINLSGGQKQRVSLARAIYSDRDVYLLDDPLSAVDAHVGKHIFENVLSSKTGLLKKKTRILVTHAISYLSKVDSIVVIKDGTISEMGTYKELMDKKGDFAEYLIQHLREEKEKAETDVDDDNKSQVLDELQEELENKLGKKVVEEGMRRGSSDLSSLRGSDVMAGRGRGQSRGRGRGRGRGRRASRGLQRRISIISEKQDKNSQKQIPERRGRFGKGQGLIVEEKIETKPVNRAVYWYYGRAVGIFTIIITFALSTLNQVFSVSTNLWLAKWSDDPNSAEPNVRDLYLGVYGGLGALTAITIMLMSLMVALGGLNASSKLHNTMLENVLLAPMSFFDTNPKGRVVNRFAKDVDYVDRPIPMTFGNLLRILFNVLGTVFVICYANPIFVAIIVPLSFLYYFIQQLYVRSSRQLKRLESVTRSPIYVHFSESLSGLSTIRAYDLNHQFSGESEDRIDNNQISFHAQLANSRWLSIRLEMLGNVIIMCAALFAVLGRETMDPGIVGLSLSYAQQITNVLNMLIRQTSQIETNMVSVERIREYQDEIVQEAPYEMPNDPSDGWPNHGVIQFENYQTRYREGLDLVLRGIDCKIRSQEKIGIVGRTGAGKSSLTMSLFRIIEAVEGSIAIDDIDIRQLGLGFLRSRLTIIPQDPVLFSGSLRSNLDPFNTANDDALWSALRHAHLHAFVSNLPSGLDHEISEGGSNLSVGQKQLVCLARALLRKTKILILDEATAAVDLETDELIQETIRREFDDCTVITIAHRLNTIMDSTRVMVLGEGRVVEFDSPLNLLSRKDSLFYGMTKEAGLVK